MHGIPGAHLCGSAVVAGLIAGSIAGCGASVPASATASAGSSPTASLASAPAASARPSPAPSPPTPTLPPGVAWIEDGVLAAGTYWFDGFEPMLEIEVPTAGWEVGHFHDELFDLFFEGDFPAIAFARFPTVATPAASASSAAGADAETPAISIDVVLDAFRANPAIVVTDVGAVEIAGLTGRTVDIEVNEEHTALFGAGQDGFHLDPGFESRFHLLAVEGGVLEIFVTGRTGDLAEVIAATQPILDSVRVVD